MFCAGYRNGFRVSILDQELAAWLIRSPSEKVGGRHGRAGPKLEDHWQPRSEPLTKGELEVPGLLAQGKGNPRIAQEPVIVWPTVKTPVGRLIRGLGVSERAQAVVRVIDVGPVGTETA